METKFRHECPDWDFMEIDENDVMFAACTCFDTPEAKEATEKMQKEIDALNETLYGS